MGRFLIGGEICPARDGNCDDCEGYCWGPKFGQCFCGWLKNPKYYLQKGV